MLDSVKDYYGKTLNQSSDLKTNACCTLDQPAPFMKDILSQIHEEVLSRYYGCGLVAPQALTGLKVLDLGSGAGRDAYTLSAMVGESGHITGVDMTDEQLDVARRHIDYHRQAFGYEKANVEFRQGYLEDLAAVGLEDNSFDVIVSNCVINLCEDKEAVLREAFRVLKPGGELYFSDVYADRRVPEALTKDPVLYGECLSGALYWQDFLTLARKAGFADPRTVEHSPIVVEDPALAKLTGDIRFSSITCRLFKVEELEGSCEDFGQAVIYQGTVAEQPDAFVLDDGHTIEKGSTFPVCGNTWLMLHNSRFKPHFEFIGNWDTHYGPFPGCVPSDPFTAVASDNSGSRSCC
jgi:arsenite methyltransferase